MSAPPSTRTVSASRCRPPPPPPPPLPSRPPAPARARENSPAVANATVGSGALGFTAGGSVTDAEVTPTVDAYLGQNVKVVLADSLGHDLFIQAKSDDAEADATAKSFGGALGLHIG